MFSAQVNCCFFVLIYMCLFFFFFFNDTATTEIYTLSLHDALPIWYFPLQPDGGYPVRTVRFQCGSGDKFALPGPCVVDMPYAGYVLTNVGAFSWNHFLL